MIDREIIALAERHLAGCCPMMRRLVGAYGPCPLGAAQRDPFHVLASSIISQQLSSRAADTIQARVHALLGVTDRLTPERLLSATPEQLRGAGLSNAKCKWLHALSERTTSGELDFAALATMDDEPAIQLLDALPGIGRWTAEMFLIFALDRLDVFALGDAGLRNGVNKLFNDGAKLADVATLEVAARWAPYRSLASWYLWRLTDANVAEWTQAR
ncbi:MAG: DNA-3-methyladenine glycosylase family protein [Panacagrimonas sp.]